MADDDIVKVRLSGTNISRLADKITELYGWTVLERSGPYMNRRDPGERVYMTVRFGYPAVVQIHAWLAANGWDKQPDGEAGAYWTKGPAPGRPPSVVGVPHDDTDQKLTGSALERIAAAEGRPLHEVLTAIEKAATNG